MSSIKRLVKWFGGILAIVGMALGVLYWKPQLAGYIHHTTEKFQKVQLANDDQVGLIDVPLENQNEGETPLENGCEVTALSMLLNFYDYDTDKNQLADLLNYVPLYEDEAQTIHGNPHEGFVGNIYEGYDAMGVAVEPISDVAEKIISDQQKVVASSETSFAELAKVVQSGTPVWVVTTVDFQVPTADDFQTWQTTNGTIKVSPLCHAAVITEVDDEHVYVNDPYGYKNRTVDRSDFEKIFQLMGSESLYLQTKE